MSESDRLIAERMGKTWERCPDGCMFFVEKGAGHEGLHYDNIPFDLSQPHHREAVIAWLNAQRMAVMTTECAAAYIVSIHETEPDGTPKIEAVCMARGTAGQKVEAFRAAVLAATEGKEQ